VAKVFVLDTNVLLFDPNSINRFGKNDVYVPLICIEELDRFKKDQNENGRNARFFSRLVDELRERGPLYKGVELDNGGRLIISVESKVTATHEYIDLSTNDNLILAAACALKEKGKDVTLISKDINLRLKADAVGLIAEDYKTKDITIDELYSGQRSLEISEEDLNRFEKEKFLPIADPKEFGLFPNEYLILKQVDNERKRLMGRYSLKQAGIVPVVKKREGIWGVYPKNAEQYFALDALMNEDIKLVTLVGKAGTGKTLLAIASGLEQCLNDDRYARVLVSRPVQPMGQDLGYLPGDVNEKLAPWMQPIFDNMDFLFAKQRGDKASSWEQLIDEGFLHIEPLTYIRGRSIPGQYMIVDEAQNLTPHEVKTIITRAGEGTKIILTGDCHQIDSPYLDSVNNGLAYCVDRLKEQDIVAHVTLTIGERSELSEIASKYL
jgi:PhoH-like ATPase